VVLVAGLQQRDAVAAGRNRRDRDRSFSSLLIIEKDFHAGYISLHAQCAFGAPLARAMQEPVSCSESWLLLPRWCLARPGRSDALKSVT
jgi:hypothetical protein